MEWKGKAEFLSSFLEQGQKVNLDEEELSHAEVWKPKEKPAVSHEWISATAKQWPHTNCLFFDELILPSFQTMRFSNQQPRAQGSA